MRYFCLAMWLRHCPAGIGLLVILALVLTGCGSANGDKPKSQQPPPIPVHIHTVQPHQVNIYTEYPGRVQGKRTVQVSARVEGILQTRHYNEGQLVKKGQLLYTIDPRPFQATVDQRKAQLASAQADLDNAQRVWKRTRRLYKANAVSEAERDQALSSLESARASVQQAKANLESARINLGYTHIEAPLSGVTSLREVDEGSLVSNGTHLTTITQLKPVYVLFALPEDDAFARGKALSEMGDKTTNEATRAATVILPGDKVYPVKGVVDFTQSTVDPSTGTVQLRALFKNKNNVLMPGRYVRVRIRLETRNHAIVIPDAAVSSSQQQTQVFLMAHGKAKLVNVDLGPSVPEGRIISKGLSPGDQVITSGLGQVKPGAPVKMIKTAQKKKSNKSKKASDDHHDRSSRTVAMASSAGHSREIHAVASTHAPRRLHMAGALGYTGLAVNDSRGR